MGYPRWLGVLPDQTYKAKFCEIGVRWTVRFRVSLTSSTEELLKYLHTLRYTLTSLFPNGLGTQMQKSHLGQSKHGHKKLSWREPGCNFPPTNRLLRRKN